MTKYYKKQQLNDILYRYKPFIENEIVSREWIEKYIIGEKRLKEFVIKAFFIAETEVILENINKNNIDKVKRIIFLFKEIDNKYVIKEQEKVKNYIIEKIYEEGNQEKINKIENE